MYGRKQWREGGSTRLTRTTVPVTRQSARDPAASKTPKKKKKEKKGACVPFLIWKSIYSFFFKKEIYIYIRVNQLSKRAGLWLGSCSVLSCLACPLSLVQVVTQQRLTDPSFVPFRLGCKPRLKLFSLRQHNKTLNSPKEIKS